MLIAPQNSAAASALANNLHGVRAAIVAAAAAAQRSEHSITLVAVSKGHAATQVRAAFALGLDNFGESYLQEAVAKRAALAALPISWHFIGRVQANKTRTISEQFDWVHAVDRLKIAERLDAQRPATLAALNVCLQVNIAGEAAKGGVAPAEAGPLATQVARLARLRLRGLMCILPEGLPMEANRRAFAAVTDLLGEINRSGLALDTLSMGMSGDYRDAILEGATMVRIGSAIFGARPPPDELG